MAQNILNFPRPDLESFCDESLDVTKNNNSTVEITFIEDIFENLHEVFPEESEENDENGNTLDETEISINNGDEDSTKIKIPKLSSKDIKPGFSFSSKQVAVLSLKRVFPQVSEIFSSMVWCWARRRQWGTNCL